MAGHGELAGEGKEGEGEEEAGGAAWGRHGEGEGCTGAPRGLLSLLVGAAVLRALCFVPNMR
jgi:hypothetical protein